MIKKHWRVFDPDGLKFPVIGYECDIDTGNAKPVSCGNVNYGPRESVIMRKHIKALLGIDHITQITKSYWMSPALLAAKPHQESVYYIEDFKWRFCVNYIRLNQITRVIVFPYPRCDNATQYSFGNAVRHFLLDCPQGFHQIGVNKRSRMKLAFAGPDAMIFTYNVMPFGPVNGPSCFIAMMFDMRHEWQQLARSRGVKIDENTDTKVIVDDLFNHAPDWDTSFTYMECIFITAAKRRLSFSQF